METPQKNLQILKTRFQNCYGIKSFKEEFDFTKKQANLIYAPNGTMKTSFAQTFKDLSENRATIDRVYPNSETIREILDQDDIALLPENVFVIDPFDGSYESNRVSTLLANRDLKEKYDSILKSIDSKCTNLLDVLKKTSGVRKNLDDLYSKAFTHEPNNLLRAFDRIKTEVYEENQDLALANIKFNSIFSEKIEKYLNDSDIKEFLREYTITYESLLNESRFFRKGVFNHYQAGEIAKQLKNHGFFKADHKVYLTSDEGETKVETEEDLEKVIEDELKNILSNRQLKSSFDKIDKELSNNKELRDFRDFLLDNQTLIPRLQVPEKLRDDLLKSYLITHRSAFQELMDEYAIGKQKIEEITVQASEQATRWQEVINIFNRRFSVPFKVEIENKQDVILKRVTPNVRFVFEDETSIPKEVERSQLLNLLSSGESRALYILNIIFEVEARISEEIPTVFVVDDIADSFDYKNKYAIVEYLADILLQGEFYQIILTHNYDFYRTLWSRLDLSGVVYLVSRSPDGIDLLRDTMYRNPFKRWQEQVKAGAINAPELVAMIPFVRNLTDYCGYEDEFNRLTDVLHVKPRVSPVQISELKSIFRKILNGDEIQIEIDDEMEVLSLIQKAAESILQSEEIALDLEKKIVLSIAIRLGAERIMIGYLDDINWLNQITKNQTRKLTKRFKEQFKDHNDFIPLFELFDRVNLMTPENIHLNSFMYEPILDMSAAHLLRLYSDIRDAERVGLAKV